MNKSKHTGFIRRLSGRRQIVLGARADLEPSLCGEFEWSATSDDPQFIIGGRLPRRGWNMIELALDHSESGAAARFYFDTGNGFSEEESIFLPLRSGRISKRICYLPAALKAIRVDPLETKGRFSIRHFRFAWLAPWFAQDRLAHRLANMHHLYREQQKKDVLRSIKAQARASNIDWKSVALARYDETFVKRCATRGYGDWIENVELPRLPDDVAVSAALEQLASQPVISVVLPVHETGERFLRQCIESVISQSYPHWQLCIADDASTRAHVRQVLDEYATQDERIATVFRPTNGHIAAASNSALALAKGEYIALLDHDDLLAEHALLRMVQAINENPDAGVLYSDEDKIDADGKRFDPHFKPQWNPDLLLSQNYVSHLGVYKTELVREVGGFREGVEGSQDHDLMLRCTARLKPDQIVHVPEVLYHWRAIEGSTADQAEEKSYTTAAGVQALRDHFSRDDTWKGKGVLVEAGVQPNTYRVRWPIPRPHPLVSLLIPTRDGFEILRRCVDSILEKTTYDNYEILILNNQSSCADTLAYLKSVQADERVRVHDWNHPFNYSSINNFGARHARGDILGLLNNDVEIITPEWLDEMVSHACRDDIGCVGAKLYYPNDTVQHGGVILGIGGVAGHAHKYFNRRDNGYFSRLSVVQNLSAVTGACLLVRRSVYEQVGGLDEENLAVAFNDVDLCLKVREAGYRNLWTPYAELYHYESLSRGADDNNKKRARARREAEYMRKRWGEVLDSDPAYNPNLTLVHEDFSLR